MATAAHPHVITVEEFLAIEWDSDAKAELDCGVIRMMAGGNARHSRIQTRVLVSLVGKLRGTTCAPYGPDMGVRTADHSLRYPDVSVFCSKDSPDDDVLQAFDDPKIIVEILSPSTRTKDLGIKLREYRQIASLDHILFIDPEAETLRLLTRQGGEWMDDDFTAAPAVPFSSFGIELAWDEIFGRD